MNTYQCLNAPKLCATAVAFAFTIIHAQAETIAVKPETVIVTTTNPSSLPAYIPTTLEGITAGEIADKINATDAQDALKYFPSLLVRKRYIGDFDHAVLASRTSGTGNSARSLVYADGILLSNLLGNGASFTPRWGLVAAEEIERVDVLYGPFSAAYPGNSVGAVVDYITRMPKKLTASVKASVFTQRYQQYGTDERYSGNQLNATLGNRHGQFAWWVSLNRLDSAGHPIAFSTKLVSQGITGAAGVPVMGAINDTNPRNQRWVITGATNQIDTIQDNAKVKFSYDISPSMRASYVFGYWGNEAKRDSTSYLRDQAGLPVYAGNVNIDGRQYNIAANEISLSRQEMAHTIHGVTLKTNSRGVFDFTFAGSIYSYDRDLTRAPAAANARPLADAQASGAGRITDQGGTGWNTLAVKAVWRPLGEAHLIDFGFSRDAHKLRNLISDTPDWLNGGAAQRASAFQGNTELRSLYAQDTMRLNDAWRATLGLRTEVWRASNGAISNALTTQFLGTRRESDVSPKFALSLQAHPDWVLKASLARAVRYPTVSELYQGSISTNVIINNDPTLRAEKSWTTELTAERDLGNWQGVIGAGVLRTTLFAEATKDALYSQTNVAVFPNITNIQNVDVIKTRGLELSLQTTDFITRGVDVTASYTFADSVITKNDKFLASVDKWQPRVPRHRANLLISWRVNEALITTFGVRHSGKQYGTLDNIDPNGDTYTGVSKFSVADIRLTYKWDKHFTLAAGIDNVNNQKYWAFHPYPQRTYMADVKWIY
jgi:iron complex outermembrane recepter protein